MLQRVIGAMRRPSTTTVNEVMSRQVVSVTPDTIWMKSALMKDEQIVTFPCRRTPPAS